MPGTEPALPIGELSNDQKFEIEALMDYIATTPQNINYNIVREIVKAIISEEPHPYFNYYAKKRKSEEPGSDSSEDLPGIE